MLKSIAIASCLTLGLAALSLEIGFRAGSPESDPFMMVGIVLALAAGPVVLWKRKATPLIPLIAVYCVIMPIAILFVALQIAWRHGKVEF